MMPCTSLLASRRALLGYAAASALLPASAAAEDAVAALIGLVRERLALMPEVARSKWNSGTPVEDMARQDHVIEGVAALAPTYGLDPGLATTFFRAQIEAAQCVQSALIARWAAAGAGPFGGAGDLQSKVRPRLDAMARALLAALAAAVPEVKRGGAERIAAAARLDDPVMAVAMARALEPLVELGRVH